VDSGKVFTREDDSTITLTLDTCTSVYSEVGAEAAEAAAALIPRAGTPAHTPHTHPEPEPREDQGNGVCPELR
jgi:hypothetical protein